MKNKKPKILLLTPWLQFSLGAETHFYTIAKELIQRGYDTSIYTFLKGKMWARMGESGVKLLDEEIDDDYDLCIMNGNPCISKAPKKSYKIMVVNGILPSAEYPVPGIDRYVAVSEEIQRTIRSLGYDSIIIRNGIDCERFKPTKPINKKLKNVLLLSNKIHPQTQEFLIIDLVYFLY